MLCAGYGVVGWTRSVRSHSVAVADPHVLSALVALRGSYCCCSNVPGAGARPHPTHEQLGGHCACRVRALEALSGVVTKLWVLRQVIHVQFVYTTMVMHGTRVRTMVPYKLVHVYHWYNGMAIVPAMP
jgi:hypothetical protein